MISVITVNWNSSHQLRECLSSIGRYGGGCIQLAMVVDNGSTDDSMRFDDPGVTVQVIRSTENLGFAKACNLGARHCSSDYILFLNPDARLMEGTIERVRVFMESEAGKGVGICGVRLVDDEGAVHRHCARFPSFFSYLWHGLGLCTLAPQIFRNHFMYDFDHMTNRKVDHVIGAFYFVRRQLFESLGGFDERYFVYLEDLDFSLRASRAGWDSYYLADAVAFHKGGGTSEQVKAKRLFYSLRSRIHYAFKNFTLVGAWGTTAVTIFLEFLTRIGYALVRGRWDDASNTLLAYQMLLVDLPAMFRAIRRA